MLSPIDPPFGWVIFSGCNPTLRFFSSARRDQTLDESGLSVLNCLVRSYAHGLRASMHFFHYNMDVLHNAHIFKKIQQMPIKNSGNAFDCTCRCLFCFVLFAQNPVEIRV